MTSPPQAHTKDRLANAVRASLARIKCRRGARTFNITTLSITASSIMGLIVTLSIKGTHILTLGVSICWVSHFLIVMLNVIMLSVTFSYCYAECHYADCRYAEWHYAQCHLAVYHYAQCLYAQCRYVECHGTMAAP